MVQISAEQFRQRLAGLAATEKGFFSENYELEDMKDTGCRLVKILANIFGRSLDPKTKWERISNAMPISAAKSRGMVDKFLTSLLEYIRAEANIIVGHEPLKDIAEELCSMTHEEQRMFIQTCVDYKMLLCLRVRDEIQTNRANIESIKAQTGASEVEILPDGSIITRGESKKEARV